MRSNGCSRWRTNQCGGLRRGLDPVLVVRSGAADAEPTAHHHDQAGENHAEQGHPQSGRIGDQADDHR